MALSDQLANLAARAKDAQTRAATAHDKAKAEVEDDVARARASAQAHAKKLQERADATKANVSSAWNTHVAEIHETIDDKYAEHDLTRARLRAASAADDAEFAIEFAYSAVEEAESAALDAHLAMLKVDELEHSSPVA